ncbi:TIGR04283 family arsenosugar biosynthesis glycosyltransferase [Blastochloris sulfoviridis]|uniref:Glycosyltransferase n=1 Tax=Blastochloris sulfoviridis TaxID=50712 RepID=A0A5M6I0Y8_9HYPH|nr:TIGR04283 family arsenosugar biosynthesis glycosyltransferase [Blastochloris sulfoviridis]KAA5601854.1 glycosyltransferase [Blastochloris sulfoviridis]
MRLSIIVPVLNEAAGIAAALARLAPLLDRGAELIVVDGGSDDDTVARARPLASHVIGAPRGRGAQMHRGAEIARGDVLLFLHADTVLPEAADRLVLDGLARSGRAWGRFDVAIAGRHPLLAAVARMMNLRSRLTGIATGDQAMFATRAAYDSAGGFADIALMEDIALSRRLRRLGPPLCLRARALTSGRRWERGGVVRTIVLMWALRFLFWCGVSPDRLARWYGYAPRLEA